MTNKEAIRLAYIEFQKDFEDGEETNQWLKKVIEGLKQAEKDLKVLEILAEYVKLGYDEVNEQYYMKLGFEERIPLSEDYEQNYAYIEISEQQYNLLQEWLENEK